MGILPILYVGISTKVVFLQLQMPHHLDHDHDKETVSSSGKLQATIWDTTPHRLHYGIRGYTGYTGIQGYTMIYEVTQATPWDTRLHPIFSKDAHVAYGELCNVLLLQCLVLQHYKTLQHKHGRSQKSKERKFHSVWHRKCGTLARMLSPTEAQGNGKNEIKQREEDDNRNRLNVESEVARNKKSGKAQLSSRAYLSQRWLHIKVVNYRL